MGTNTAAHMAHWVLSARPGSSLGQLFRPVREWLDSALPQGDVTFLLGDATGSTRMWEQDPEAAAEALERMELHVAEVVERGSGLLPRDQGEGDSFFAVFASARDGVGAALELQSAFRDLPMKVRMAVHTGQAQLRSGNYFGVEVNRCSRIRCLAEGSQVLISRATYEAVGGIFPSNSTVRSLGSKPLRDLSRPEELFALEATNQAMLTA